MIKFIKNKKFSEAKENFILIAVDCSGEINTKYWKKISERYPHVEKEYIKRVKHEKNKYELLGCSQFVPVDNWAMIMVDNKNNTVEAYDKEYQYIVTSFVKESCDSIVDVIAVKRILEDIKKKAEKINASISIPYNFACTKNLQWDEMYSIIKELFDNTNVEINIYNINQKNT